MGMEVRSIQKYEIREIQQDNTVEIEGYIAKFDSLTELFEGYYEKIDRNAFENTLSDGHNILLLYHHDITRPLASTKTGTLELNTDNIGLRFKAKINNNLSYAKDTIELIKQGLIQGCSFGFNSIRDSVEYNGNEDRVIRTLLEVYLGECSVLCVPQYEDTMVYARAKTINSDERKKLQDKKGIEIRRQKLKLELNLI